MSKMITYPTLALIFFMISFHLNQKRIQIVYKHQVLIINFKMKSYSIFLLLVLSVYVSCSKLRMLQKDSGWNYKINCKNFDQKTGTCKECFEGCTKWENICVKIVEHCGMWDEEGNCTKCQSGYGDQSNNSIDGACPKHQTNNQTIGSQGNQTTPSVDVNCQCHTEDRVCIDCFPGYYLDVNTTCQQLPGNCTAANKKGQCTGCVEGFRLENGYCVQKVCDTSLCISFNADQTQCVQCPQRSYLQSGCCFQVNGYCSEWVQSTGECTACYQGYEINKENPWQCILSSSS